MAPVVSTEATLVYAVALEVQRSRSPSPVTNGASRGITWLYGAEVLPRERLDTTTFHLGKLVEGCNERRIIKEQMQNDKKRKAAAAKKKAKGRNKRDLDALLGSDDEEDEEDVKPASSSKRARAGDGRAAKLPSDVKHLIHHVQTIKLQVQDTEREAAIHLLQTLSHDIIVKLDTDYDVYVEGFDVFKVVQSQQTRAEQDAMNWISQTCSLGERYGCSTIKAKLSLREDDSGSEAFPYYFTLTVDAYHDFSWRSHDPDFIATFRNLLSHVMVLGKSDRDVLQSVKARSGKAYRRTNITWFYTCLPRPPPLEDYAAMQVDRKGKGKAIDQPPQEILPPHLNPTLLPFQSRSLAWMLRREGKQIAGRDDEGFHYVEDIKDTYQALDSRRSSLWERSELVDGTPAWINTLTYAVAFEDPAKDEPDAFEGSIAAEEMGLGKTVEILSLILLNTDSERAGLPSYVSEELTCEVHPSGATLLVCPQAIIQQWQDEIERHAPTLRVFRYLGMKKHKSQDLDFTEINKNFDVVLCTFDILRVELAIAKKPVVHTTRRNAHKEDKDKINYRRSMLVSIDWLRVVVDEAQMAASTTSAISITASLIPRKYSWAVSGTPIKENINDLAGLLKFLRIEGVGEDPKLFDQLIASENAAVFTKLVSRIGIRTIKAQIADELTLPPQERYIVPVRFSAIEQFNYRNKYHDALVDMGLSAEAVRPLRDGGDLVQCMSRWLHLLRQACFHAQAGAQAYRRPTGHTVKGGIPNNVVQTLEEVLFNMRERNIADLHAEQRAKASAIVQRAYVMMYDKELCERFEDALELLKVGKRELHLLAEDIYNELLLILPEATRNSPVATMPSRNGATLPGHAYLTAFKETVKEAIEAAKEVDGDTHGEAAAKASLMANLSRRLRETVIRLHEAVFFMGNAYFALGTKQEEEAAAYAEAEALRRQVLRGDEEHALNIIRKMQKRLKEKPIRNIEFEPTQTEPGLQSGRIFDEIDELAEVANKQSALLMKWRQVIIEALVSSLTEDEVSAEEYQNKAEVQEKLDVYIECYTVLQADWIQTVTGTRSTLASNLAAATSVANNGPGKMQPVVQVPQPTGQVSKRSLFKKKAGMTTVQANALKNAQTPADRLRAELENERKAVITRDFRDSLRNQLRELQHLKERVMNQQEISIIVEESKRLRYELSDKDKLIEQLKAESTMFANVYNARVEYFRLLQEFSDAVAELPAEQATPGAIQATLKVLRAREDQFSKTIMPKIARRRFLDSLQTKNREEEVCLICSDTENGQIVLTHCGHIYHETCLKVWLSRAGVGMRNCPVCRAMLSRNDAWHKVHLKAPGQDGQPNGVSKPEVPETLSAGSPTVNGKSSSNKADGAREVTDLDDDAPLKHLNFLPAQEADEISKVRLRGAALGSKLDSIVQHVVHLRDKHKAKMEMEDDDDGRRGQSRTAGHSWSSTGGKSRKGKERATTNGQGRAHDDSHIKGDAKILIYSGWLYACDVLAAALSNQGIGFVRLEASGTKSLVAHKKENAVIEFKENPDVTVFILHAKSQAAGLNLIAAQYVILVEPLLETALEIQAIARVHRIGQRQKTTVFQYVIPNTVDEKIAMLSLNKKNHDLFNREQRQASLMSESTSSIPNASESNGERGLSRTPSGRHKKRAREEPVDEAGDSQHVDEDDLAGLLLDKNDSDNLQAKLLQRAREAQERARREARQAEAAAMSEAERMRLARLQRFAA